MVSATWEAEARELLEPRRGCSELKLHHCTPAWATRVKLCHKEINKQKGFFTTNEQKANNIKP